jgi:integrase
MQIPGTKTEGAKRQVPIAEEAREAVLRRVHAAGPDGKLFPLTSTGKKALENQKRAWLRALRGACKRAKVGHASTNDLRRTFCSWAWQAGVPEDVVVRWMGHTSAKMVREVYGQPSKEQGAREIAKMPKRGGAQPSMTALEPFSVN